MFEINGSLLMSRRSQQPTTKNSSTHSTRQHKHSIIHTCICIYILNGLCLIFAHLRICACVFSWLVCAYFLSWQVGVSCGIPHCRFLSFNLLYVILLLVAVLERMKLTITSNFAHQWIGKINLVEGNLKRILSYIPTYM